ncbi:MAG: DUF4173 domain-containing protein [Clostridia bacterium]|nr:DUF4173 domain-containing protein [Clostridia bacterium]
MDANTNTIVNNTQNSKNTTLFSLEKTDIAFAICAIAFSVFTAVFGICGGYALGYLISCMLVFVLFVIYFIKNAKAKFLPIFSGILAIANAAVFVCTSNSGVRFFGALASFLLAIVCFDGLVVGRSKGNRETLGIFYTAIATISNIGVSLKSLLVGKEDDKKLVAKALVGIALAIPVLFVVIPLLISSDDAFRGMMNNIFGDAAKNIFKVIFGLILSIFVISYGFSLKKGRVSRAKKGELPGVENVYLISFLTAINLCYMLYLFSQLAYFFSAFKGFLPNGDITYAEYARKGFFEMCTIAVINLVLVFISLLIAKKNNGKVSNTIKCLATFMAVFTLIIITTAISKMVMYIDTYGMTVLRLTTSAFMVFLAIVFISVILRIFILKINIVNTSLITAGCILLILGTLNVNAVCAKYNYESYVSQRLRTIDINALYELGDEGVPYIVKLTEDKDYFVSESAKKYLARAIVYNYFEDLFEDSDLSASSLKEKEKEKGFERFSIPKAIAYESIYQFLEQNPNFSYYTQGL